MSRLYAEQSLHATESTLNKLSEDHHCWCNVYSVYRYRLSHTFRCWRSVYCLATSFDLAYRSSSGRLYTNRNTSININCVVRKEIAPYCVNSTLQMYIQRTNVKQTAEDFTNVQWTAGHTVLSTYLLTNSDHAVQQRDGRECVIYGNRQNTESSFVEWKCGGGGCNIPLC